MFRLAQCMQELIAPTPLRHRSPPGPVVIWNLIRRCNLNCIHCYSLSADGAGDDGLLKMSEILALRINAELVVLSACNTATVSGFK